MNMDKIQNVFRTDISHYSEETQQHNREEISHIKRGAITIQKKTLSLERSRYCSLRKKRSRRQGEKKTIVFLGGEERTRRSKTGSDETLPTSVGQSRRNRLVSFSSFYFHFSVLASLKLPFVWLSCCKILMFKWKEK